MAAEPRTIRETVFVLEGVEGRVGILQRMIWWVYGLLGAIIAGAVAILFQIGDLKTDLAVAKNTLNSIEAKLTRIEKGIENRQVGEAKILTILSRIQSSQAPDTKLLSFFALTRENAASIKAELLAATAKPASFAKLFAGDQLKDDELHPVPANLVAKFPKLAGARYAIDRTGTLGLTPPNSNEILGLL